MRLNDPQTLIIDADDTLWENNIYFEQAWDDFLDAVAQQLDSDATDAAHH